MSDRPLPVLVGESPSRTGDRYWRLPLSGAPARTLCECAGWPPDGPGIGGWTWALYERFTTVNVFARYAEATPWSLPRARARADAIVNEAIIEAMKWTGDAPRFVLLGKRVAAAFGVGHVDFYRVVRLAVGTAVVIPHPSGRNLLLNSPETRERIGRALREATGDTTGRVFDI